MRFSAELEDAGKRLDVLIQERMPDQSRARIQSWIKAQRATVNGVPAKPSHVVHPGDAIEITPAAQPPLKAFAEEIPVEVLYSDADVVAVNKPAGMVVHAGAGRRTGTLVNALLHHFGTLSGAGGEERPGIVHRLDRETSGVLLVARNDAAHRSLAEQFAAHSIDKTYTALVQGVVTKDRGDIKSAITRDPVRRIRMTARLGRGREAHTEYRVIRRFPKYTLLSVDIYTGRTHQIRAHLASIGHPVAGDTVYGAARSTRGRFFLHARRIAFTSPSTGERVVVEAPLPPELESWLAEL